MHVMNRAAIAVIATVALAACSTGGSASTAPATSSGPVASGAPASSSGPAAAGCSTSTNASTVAATVANFQFSPNPIQAKVGDVIKWTNNGPSNHTVTMDSGACDTGVIANGASASLVFTVAGTYAYHCTIHASMKGTIVVGG